MHSTAGISCVSTVDELETLDLGSFPSRREPERILMCEPRFFDIVDAKNPFMTDNLHCVDRALAASQWRELVDLLGNLGRTVFEIPPVEGLEDMVFCANQALPFEDDGGRRIAIMSAMKHASRQREIPHFAQWFRHNGYILHELASAASGTHNHFEGQGDAIWHPGRRLLWGGFGFRTSEHVYDEISQLVNATVLRLRLVNQRFYHLDTAFCPLDAETVMIFPEAFHSESLALIRRVFKNVIQVDESEAGNFACNALVLGRHVVLQKGSLSTVSTLRSNGFNPIEVDTSEFLKSGGSVFCLKMMVF